MKLNFELFFWDYFWFIWAGLALLVAAITGLVIWLRRRREAKEAAERKAAELRILPDPIEALLLTRAADITAHNATAEDRQFHVTELRYAVRFLLDLGIDAPGPSPLRPIMVNLLEGDTTDVEPFLAWYANENRSQPDAIKAQEEDTDLTDDRPGDMDDDALADHESNPFEDSSALDQAVPEPKSDIAGLPDFNIADAARALAAFVLLRDDNKALRCYRLAVKKSEDDVNHLLRLGQFMMRGGDLAKARKPLAEALEIAEALGDEEGIARAKLALGRLSHKRGQSKKAFRYIQAAADYGDKTETRDLAALAHRSLGEIYLQREDYEKALEELDAALELETMLGFNDAMATTHRRIGQVKIELGDFDAAEKELSTARNLLEVLGEKPDLMNVLRDKAILFNRQKNYDASLGAFDDALALAREIKHHAFFADLLGEKAQIQIKRFEPREAEALYGRAIIINQKLKRHDGTANICRLLGELYEKEDDHARAIGVVREAERLYRQINNKEDALRMTGWIGRLRASM